MGRVFEVWDIDVGAGTTGMTTESIKLWVAAEAIKKIQRKKFYLSIKSPNIFLFLQL